MKKNLKIVLESLEEYSDAIFDYGKTYSLYERRPTIFKKHLAEDREKAVAAYEKLKQGIINLATKVKKVNDENRT